MFGKNKKNEYRHDDESNKNNELDLLTQVSIELSSIPSTDDIYIYLGKKLKEISGAIAVAVSEYSNSKKVIITRYVETESEKLNKFINISGVKIIGLESPVSELDYSLITESVIGYKDSLSDVTFGTINPIISKIVNKTFRIGKFIGIAYIFDNQLYGTSVLVMKKGDPLPSEQLLRLFAGLAWVSLRRISAERELRESENKYRTLFSHSALAVALRNPDWEFVECNDAYLTMLGYRRDEIQNLTLENISHPDDIQFTKDAINRVRSGVSEIEKYEKRYVHKSGEIVWGEVCLQSLKNPKGRIVAFIGTVIIITERKIAEEKLRKSEANYRLIADNAADVIWRMDINLNITYISPSCKKIFDWSPEEFKNLSISEYIAPSAFNIVMKKIAEELRIFETVDNPEDYSVNFEIEMLRKDKSSFWADITAKGVVDDNKKLIGIIGITRDISERKNAEIHRKFLEEQLIQTQKMETVGRLSGGIAHDLNNMLTPILGYAEILLQELPVNDKKRKRVENIIKGVENSRDLIKQLLAFARKQKLEIKPININRIIKEFEIMLKRTIRENISIIFNPDERIKLINGDAVQIQQIIMNLCLNSQDAITDSGSIIIDTKNIDVKEQTDINDIAPGNYAVLTVSDTGQGMDKLTKERIYEPFFTTKGLGTGTGLGLSTVYGIVNQHGGYIHCESEPGLGAKFNIYFPAIEDIEVIGCIEDTLMIPDRGNETIMIVEDRNDVLELVSEYLKLLGYNIITASSGAAAIRIYSEINVKIHLLVTDIILPDINGKQVYQTLLKKNPILKVLFMSGYSDNILSNGKESINEFNFIQKPFNLNDFAGKIRAIIDSNFVNLKALIF